MSSLPAPLPDRAPERTAGPGLGAYAALLLAGGLLAFFSLRASPYLSELPWLPRDFTRWADRHGILRNTVAFFPFGLLLFGWLGRGWLPVLTSAAFAALIEVPQFWLPQRYFDLRDIWASWGGLALGWFAVTLWICVRRVLPAPVSRP